MRTKTFKDFSLLILPTAFLIILALSISSAGLAPTSSSNLIPHDPIFIRGDGGFTPANGVTSGSGTVDDPYIIENWAINASEAHGISIRNTTKYFVIRNCLVENSRYPDYGIYLDNVVNGEIRNNICRNDDWHGIFLYNSSNNNLSNNTCENNHWGIWLGDSSSNTISSNTCENNVYGIELWSSSNNILSNNVCSNNYYGVHLSSSSNNTLTSNTCKNNGNEVGIYLSESSNNNTLTSNTCKNNGWGIYIVNSCDFNTITHNYLLDSTENSAYDNSVNYWDENGEGNYWSDWQPPDHPDADGDGIVDEPRPIAGGNNRDEYPLVLLEFLVWVSPTSTSVQQGSGTTVAVAVTRKYGHDLMVSLTASGQPSGVSVNFSPSSGAPPFISTMTINVDSDAQIGRHMITITGTGADDKVINRAYTLIIIPPNGPPTADADGPYSVQENGTVELDGTGSSDPDGDTLTYLWTITNDPTGKASLTGADTATPTFQAPAQVDEAVEITVELTVDDGQGHTDSDTTILIVQSAVTPTQTGPTATPMGPWLVVFASICIVAAIIVTIIVKMRR